MGRKVSETVMLTKSCLGLFENEKKSAAIFLCNNPFSYRNSCAKYFITPRSTFFMMAKIGHVHYQEAPDPVKL